MYMPNIHTYYNVIETHSHIMLYSGGLPFEIKESSSSMALFETITCTSSEESLSDCNIQEGDCMKYCSTIMGLKCFGEYFMLYCLNSEKVEYF